MIFLPIKFTDGQIAFQVYDTASNQVKLVDPSGNEVVGKTEYTALGYVPDFPCPEVTFDA